MTSFSQRPVTVRACATSANLGPGFDTLGLCLDLADQVTAEACSAGTAVEITGEGAGHLPTDDSHLVVATMRAAFDAWALPQPGLRLRCVNLIPQERGLGSSAAAIVAGLRLAQALIDSDADGHGHAEARSDRALLRLAAELDGHADNVAAGLYGGLVVTWSEASGPVALRLDVHPDVRPVVLCAPGTLATSSARRLLPETVPHAVAAANSARAALLIAALTQHPDLLLAATVDLLHQEARRSAYQESLHLVERLRDGVGVAAVISGAGPSVVVLCLAGQEDRVCEQSPAGWRPIRCAIDPRGTRLSVA